MKNQSEIATHICTSDDEQHVLLVQYVLTGWISSFIVLFGICGNAFSIIILSNHRMRYLSTNIYLLALSIVNFIWLILYFFVNSLRFTLIVPKFLVSPDENDHHNYDDFVQRSFPYVLPLMNTFQLCSIYYTVAVSFDRFLYLSYGVQAERICTVRNSLRIVTLITISSTLFILPHWFKHRVVPMENNRVQLKLTSIGENESFRKMIHIWLYIPIVYAIPFVLLILINFFTIKLLQRFYSNRRQKFNLTLSNASQNDEQHERDITLMLIGVVLLFFICRFPMLINHIFETKYSLTSSTTTINSTVEHRRVSFSHCRSRRLFNTSVNFLQTINASANLFFYYLFGGKFRETSSQLAKLVRKSAIRRHNSIAENLSSFVQRRPTTMNIVPVSQQQFSTLLNIEQKNSFLSTTEMNE